MSGLCELCRAAVLQVHAEGWDGGLECGDGHRHHVCAKCAAEWGLAADVGAGRVDPCLDAVRTALAVAGETPAAGEPLVRAAGPGRSGNPALAGLTPEEQDALERDIRDSIAAQVARDVDEALRRAAP